MCYKIKKLQLSLPFLVKTVVFLWQKRKKVVEILHIQCYNDLKLIYFYYKYIKVIFLSDIYSYHTFILPFVWKDSCNDARTFEKFTQLFANNPYWKCYDPEDENSFSHIEDEQSYYAEYQYFYPQVRSALYGFGENVVRTFHFAHNKVQNQAHYYISKNDRTYDLLLNSIQLKIYNTGIALFVLEGENHGTDKDGKPQNTFGDVKNINDFGRRVTLPFIPDVPGYSICADSLEIVIPGLGNFRTDFAGYIKKTAETKNKKEHINLNHLSNFIKEILSFSSDNQFSSKINNEKNTFYIHPALDDRMFVASLVIDKEETNKMIEVSKETGEYAYEKDDELSKSLYEFIFIDNQNSGCSCNCKKMRQELLEKHVYRRWIEAGSLYGVAAQSIVLLFDGGFEPLINTFITTYVRIACLCLAQRASLMNFQKEAADISRLIHEKESKIQIATVTKLMDLQERFSAFESQICFAEITPQEQGIEIYSMFFEFFFIDKELENVKSQIDGLHDATDTYLDFGFNKIALIFTLVGGILGIMQIVNTDARLFEQTLWIYGSVASIVIAFIVIFVYRRKRKK